MGKVITVHSFKGGTGKSVIVANLALACVMRNKKVCVFDLDFRAPSLGVTFSNALPDYTTNDYLDGYCELEDVLVDLSSMSVSKGQLMVGLASHSPDKIQEFMTKGKKWEMKALKRLYLLKKTLIEETGVDYIFLDTSPGVQYSSINAISVADAVLVVNNLDESDIDGTRGMIKSVYEPLGKKVFFLVNKYPSATRICLDKAEADEVLKLYKPLESRVTGIIPCFCEILKSKRSSIFILANPDHPFKSMIEELAETVIGAF